MKKLLQSGDTIVEVLIAVTIISVILAGAFGVTRMSTAGVRDAQEHLEATGLMESQIEMIRANATTVNPKNANSVFNVGNPFCMYYDPITQVASAYGYKSVQCYQNSAGQETSVEPIYHVNVHRSNSCIDACTSGLSGSLFKPIITWNNINGNSQTNVSTLFRMYP